MPLSRGRLWLARGVAIVVGLTVGVILAEAALRAVEKAAVKDRVVEPNLVSDPLLGRKLPPYAIGHDANGFRNDSVPAHVDIVAIGDSQTWGVNVGRSDAWPQQLAGMSGHKVYNMSLGGFGAVQYSALMEKALALTPKTIVIGLYLGNDLYDAYQLVYTNDN